MKEKFIGRLHLIFYKNYERYIIPTFNYVPKSISCPWAVNFMWLKWRITIIDTKTDRIVRHNNYEMRDIIKLCLSDVNESRFTAHHTSLRTVYEWIDSFFHSVY